MNEHQFLRDLAKKQLELANLPIMKEREKAWYAHNSLQGEKPMIVMEEVTFWQEICPPLQCTGALEREIEENIYKQIIPYEVFNDDKVIAPYYTLDFSISYKPYGIDMKKVYASDHIGFHIEPAIEIIEDDFDILSPTKFSFDANAVQEKKAKIEAIIGDILPVVEKNTTNVWDTNITKRIVDLMGTENMFCSMITEPEEYHRLMSFVTNDLIRMLRFQEEVDVLQLNNGNDYLGSGSFCFNNETKATGENGKVLSRDMWGHINSQESVGISRQSYIDFVLPYITKLSKEFAAIYYGCCEPVSDFWKDGLEKIDNIRKISISPWCDEAFMAEALTGRKTIYSRKPSPNFIGIDKSFDDVEFRKYIRNTVALTKNLKKEFIFRDVYTLKGNIEKTKQAVQIVREEIERG